MIVRVELIRAPNVDDNKFESAFYCALTSIKSVLYEKDVIIESKTPYIFIKEETAKASLPAYKELLSGCFTDSSGRIYEDFQVVNITAHEEPPKQRLAIT
jgi:hypothetical protein